MPDEQHETLTLDDLLGLSGGPSERASVGGIGMLEESSELLRELVSGAEETAPLSLDNLPSLPKIPAGLVPVEPEKEPEPQPEPAPAKQHAPEVGEASKPKQEPKQKAQPEQDSKPHQQPKQKQKQKTRSKLESKQTQEARPEQEFKLKQATELGPKSEPKQRYEPELQQDRSESAPARLCETSYVPHEPRFVRKGKHARGEAKERAFSGKHAASVAKEMPEQRSTGVAVEPKPTEAPKPAPVNEPATMRGAEPQPTLVSEPASQPAPTLVPEFEAQRTSAQNELAAAPKLDPVPEPTSAPAESSASRLERLNELSRRLESQILASSATFQQPHEKVTASAAASASAEAAAANVTPGETSDMALDATPNTVSQAAPDQASDQAPNATSADALSPHEQPLPDWCAEVSPEESHLFDEPPQTIAEGMQDGQREHLRIVRIKIALGAMAVLLVVACVVGVAQQLVTAPDAQSLQSTEQLDTKQTPGAPSASDSPNSPDGDRQSNAASQPNSANPADPSTTSNQPQSPQQDRSGTVVYRYVTNNATGTDCTITETVAFNQEGLCETSEMEVKLADETAAQDFAQAMQRDYGPDAEVSVDGTTVRAQLPIASNALDREAYEDALRTSVRDLTIVKKS